MVEMRNEKNDFGKNIRRGFDKRRNKSHFISLINQINHFIINLIEYNPYHLISLFLTIFMKKGGIGIVS